MSADKTGTPPLADLVRAGESQTEAITVADGIFMAQDISNAYLITTADGDVMVNTGFMAGADRNKGLFAPVRTGPLRKIFVTQAHPDHYGGVPAFKEADTQVVTQRRFPETAQYFKDLNAYLGRRSGKLWAFNRKGAAPPVIPDIVPDVTIDRRAAFEVGGRTFEAISTPGGETLCGLTIWMPDEKIAFTGNLFGPVWKAVPNLVTTRGDKPRLVTTYLESLDLVRNLGAALLITGHGEPIRGAARIRADLDILYDAVSYIRDETIAGMNAGKTVHALMRSIRLPEPLRIGEFHGKVSWAVRSIWEEMSGWFHYEDGTTALYAVPRSSIDADLVELAGGATRIAERARARLDAGEPLEALHLLDVALAAEPLNDAALKAKRTALGLLLDASGGTNLSETMWLRSEIAGVEGLLSPSGT